MANSDLLGNETLNNVSVPLANGNPSAVNALKSTASLAGAGGAYGGTISANASTALASIPGMSATLLSGVYKFNCVIPSAGAAGGGAQYAFSYSSAMTVQSLTAAAVMFTAAGLSATVVTSTTGQAALASQAIAVVETNIEGYLSTSTGGVVTLQFAQSTSSASTSTVYAGAVMQFVKIGL